MSKNKFVVLRSNSEDESMKIDTNHHSYTKSIKTYLSTPLTASTAITTNFKF